MDRLCTASSSRNAALGRTISEAPPMADANKFTHAALSPFPTNREQTKTRNREARRRARRRVTSISKCARKKATTPQLARAPRSVCMPNARAFVSSADLFVFRLQPTNRVQLEKSRQRPLRVRASLSSAHLRGRVKMAARPCMYTSRRSIWLRASLPLVSIFFFFFRFVPHRVLARRFCLPMVFRDEAP